MFDIASLENNQQGYNDPKAIYLLEKWGDLGMWLLPTATGLFSISAGYPQTYLFLSTLGLAQAVFVNRLKKTFPKQRPRPFKFGEKSNEDMKSFPSSHTAGSFLAVGLSVGFFGPSLVTITTLALASLVGLSRFLSKKHWPADIAAGALIGFSNGLTCAILTKRF